jgi:hypothetical protein
MYSPLQNKVIGEFLKSNAGDYEIVRLESSGVFLAIEKDRAVSARNRNATSRESSSSTLPSGAE